MIYICKFSRLSSNVVLRFLHVLYVYIPISCYLFFFFFHEKKSPLSVLVHDDDDDENEKFMKTNKFFFFYFFCSSKFDEGEIKRRRSEITKQQLLVQSRNYSFMNFLRNIQKNTYIFMSPYTLSVTFVLLVGVK